MNRMSRRSRTSPANRAAWRAALAAVFCLAPAVASPAIAADPRTVSRPAVLDLEAAVSQAELILAVRLADVTETRIVHGGQVEEVTEQYRLEPVRVLKGIFARESLLMTGADLGVYRFAEKADALQRGQMLLVFLERRNGSQLVNCNTAATLGQSIPRLGGADDPLLSAVDVLIAAAQRRDRAERIALLRDGLKTATGRDAVPLMLALQRRALVAAQTPGTVATILPRLQEGSPVVREIAARTIAVLLDADDRGRATRAPGPAGERPEDRDDVRIEAVGALATALATSGDDYRSRVAILDAIGAAGPAAAEVAPAAAALRSDRPAATFAERAALLRAVGRVGLRDQAERVAKILQDLPLDAPAEYEAAAAESLIRLGSRPGKDADLLTDRLQRKSEAGLRIAADIARLDRLPRMLLTHPIEFPAVDALLKAFARPLDYQEQLAFATAARNVADARLVPALGTLLAPGKPQVRHEAIEALRRIDTDEAASVLWPHLDEEPNVARKLELIAFLGRHGFKDRYPVAIEHLSQPTLRDLAVEALAALGDPRAIPELRRIWATSHDLAWNAAAIRGLARLGQADIIPRLLEIAANPADPLAESALIGLGDLGAPRALALVRDGLASRSDAIAIASARAATKLLARPDPGADPIRDRLAALLADPMASNQARVAALSALATLDDPRLGPALAAAVRDVSLEGTDLGARIEAELGKRTGRPGPER
ncbi:HEAT repeat domain-containing protein [Tundrisphaera sp. TA3]|uniref:HEAT repeat domain-containing protein n=1 Tax=Tundrisphaera sp. TA3 TaxID=3435775 RepID=UPI003EBCA65F